MGSQKVRHDSVTNTHIDILIKIFKKRMLGETRGSHGLCIFPRAVAGALLGIGPHQSQAPAQPLSSPKSGENENKMINWMEEGQLPTGFSWIRRGMSDKCLGLMSTLQSS